MDLMGTEFEMKSSSFLSTEISNVVSEHFNLVTNSCDDLNVSYVPSNVILNHADAGYSCLECHEVFHEIIGLNLHINSKHSTTKRYVCEECNAMFFSSHKYKLHCNSKHDIARPFKCEICRSTYSNIAALKTHLRRHEANPPSFKCNLCGRSFATKSSLKTHALRHGTDMPHICDVCNKSFAIKGDLRTHYLKHDPMPQFKCEHCGKAFPRKGNLIRHTRKHTGEKPYKCFYCEKRFSRSENCREHQRTHTNEKRFMCNICGASFSDSGNFCKHKKAYNCNKKTKIRRRVKNKKECVSSVIKHNDKVAIQNLNDIQPMILHSTNNTFPQETLAKSLEFTPDVQTCRATLNQKLLFKSLEEFSHPISPALCETVPITYRSEMSEQSIHPDGFINGNDDIASPDEQSEVRLEEEKATTDGHTDGQAFFLVDHYDPSFSFISDSNLFIDASSIFLQQQNEREFQTNLYNDKQFNQSTQSTSLLCGSNSAYYCVDDNEIDTNKFLNDDYLLKKSDAFDTQQAH